MEKTYWEKREEWKKVKPRVKWFAIQVGHEYIIPPILDQKLRHVRVLSYFNNRYRVQILNNPENRYSDFRVFDNYDVESRHFVEVHKLSSTF